MFHPSKKNKLKGPGEHGRGRGLSEGRGIETKSITIVDPEDDHSKVLEEGTGTNEVGNLQAWKEGREHVETFEGG